MLDCAIIYIPLIIEDSGDVSPENYDLLNVCTQLGYYQRVSISGIRNV